MWNDPKKGIHWKHLHKTTELKQKTQTLTCLLNIVWVWSGAMANISCTWRLSVLLNQMVHIVLLPSLGMFNGCVSMNSSMVEASRHISHISMHASIAVSLLPHRGFVTKFGFLQKKKKNQQQTHTKSLLLKLSQIYIYKYLRSPTEFCCNRIIDKRHLSIIKIIHCTYSLSIGFI